MRRRLTELGARKLCAGNQRNEYLDRGDFLKSQRTILRLRRDSRGEFLTLKGPKLPGRYTKRIEYETPVRFDQTKSILAVLGFRPFRRYVKTREEYRLGKCLIALDHLPGRGHRWYLEIEGPVKDIRNSAGRLGLTPQDREERSYLAILFPSLMIYDRPQ